MTVRKEYRVNGVDDYVIDIVPQAGGTYGLQCPLHPADCHGRGAAHHHLYESGAICIGEGREPRTVAAAEEIAEAWVEGWSEYRRTGRFPGS